MTIHRYLNVYGRGGNHTTWWLIKAMTDAGWTVPMSGSGLGGLYATGNVFDLNHTPKQWNELAANGVGVGSEPWGYAYCWIVLQAPTGTRQILVQRDSSSSTSGDDEWWFRCSSNGTFGDGQTPGVDWDQDTVPAATEGYNIWGSDGGWASLFESGGAATITHVAADDTPSPSGEYGVFLVEQKQTRIMNGYLMFDDVRNVQPGNYDHWVSFIEGVDQSLTVGNIGGVSVSRYGKVLLDGDGPGRAAVDLIASRLAYGATSVIPQLAGIGTDNKERCMPLVWGFADNLCYVGLSRWLLWQGAGPNYLKTANAKTLLAIDDCYVRDLWDGASLPAYL